MSVESFLESEPVTLTEADQAWLTSFGVDASWLNNEVVCNELAEIVTIGSLHINVGDNDTKFQEIVLARERFFEFVGIGEQILSNYRIISPTLIPIDTFIATQRIITQLGLNAVKIINAHPSAINLAPESVRAKVDNFTDLGLNAVKIINALPAAIDLAPESVRAKVDNFTDLGLDAVKIINAHPSAINLAPESVRAKVDFLIRSVKLLKWAYSAEELIETYPSILGFSTDKLKILRRIAATVLTDAMREAMPSHVRNSLIKPLEKYILSISEIQDHDPDKLLTLAIKNKLSLEERRASAIQSAQTGNLGRIGAMYLEYAKVA